ncbi:uncharacterized protein LOC126839134 isoform X3 [Adelges cooleyi]|uniref:uncharacterized protein LOC126839134 isoform X3 n=1 Tax=Adelges cooleyi TaxID=133065 RepID=UPI00217F438C|nr:uncharacterized protein LOC126839134 isoform X3 [Adelges cooleyi]XP_050430169.1 uncharacterized protein LOC126839134 isoform X3 [Adelges cooleyi]XP_050430170.1 uncharacterized protein LOC126839134 isoform X3 [Adelges cooleyi]XP_050430171.1 uncharacterized protein LOC126839134 isoform X3 [Adelges cooleyi]
MKLFCLLLCLFFVDVLANEDESVYINYVFKTTATLREAYLMEDFRIHAGDKSRKNGLELVIETMNDATDFYHLEIVPRIEALPAFGDKTQKANILLQLMTQNLENILGGATLEKIASKRRRLVAWTLKNVIGRRIIETVQDGDDEASLLLKCRFLGVFASTQTPSTYITKVDIDLPARTCIFTDINEGIKRYNTADVVFLEKLIREGHPQTAPY